MTPTSQAPKRAPTPVYLAMTIVIFVFTLSAADSVGFVPYYIDGSTPLTTGGSTPAQERVALSALPELGSEVVASGEETVVTALPGRIVIPEINLDLPVQNPSTRDIAALDELLKDGPVRYVDSAKLGEKGNVLIFAHTSHLPVVKNQKIGRAHV